MLRYFVRFGASASMFMMLGLLPVTAQTAAPASSDKPAAPKAMKIGDTLSGQLTVIRTRAKKGKKAAPTFQLVSEPRRLPAPSDLCNLETGPETFQVTATDAQAAQLKPLIGKQVSLKVDGIMCAEEAGVMSEAIVTRWSLVK